MTHPRKTIRDNAATLLTGLGVTGSNVFGEQVYPLEAGDLPALRIYVGDDQRMEGQSAGTTMSEFELIIEIVTAASSGMSDQIDNIIEDIEDQVDTDPTLSSTLIGAGLKWQSTARPQYSDEAEKPHAVTEITYTGKYERSR